MFIYFASGVHLFPDVIVGEEAPQLSLCQRSTVIGVTVAREHVDAQSLNFTDIHRSEIEYIGNENMWSTSAK